MVGPSNDFLFWDSREIRWQASWDQGGGACRPAKFKELGLPLCRGQNALHSPSLGQYRERDKCKAEIAPRLFTFQP